STCSSDLVIARPRFFFSSRRRHTRFKCDWSSDVCSSDLRNFSNVHRIPLGVTDAVLPRPQSINHLGFAAMNVARNIGTSHWRYLDMKWTRLLRSFPILCFVTNSRTTRHKSSSSHPEVRN